jgi:hypothetical protein
MMSHRLSHDIHVKYTYERFHAQTAGSLRMKHTNVDRGFDASVELELRSTHAIMRTSTVNDQPSIDGHAHIHVRTLDVDNTHVSMQSMRLSV